MARPVNYPDFLAEAALWDAPGNPPAYEDDEELEVGALFLRRMLALAPPDEEEEEDWDDGDSGYGSCSEEDEDEDEGDAEDMAWEVEDGALEEEDDDQRFPPEEFWDGWHQRAQSPSPAPSPSLKRSLDCLLPLLPCLHPPLPLLFLLWVLLWTFCLSVDPSATGMKMRTPPSPRGSALRTATTIPPPPPQLGRPEASGATSTTCSKTQPTQRALLPLLPSLRPPTSLLLALPLWVLHPPPLLGRSRGSFPQRCVSYEELSMVSSTHWSEAPPEGALIQKSHYTHSGQVFCWCLLQSEEQILWDDEDSGYGSCSEAKRKTRLGGREEEDEDWKKMKKIYQRLSPEALLFCDCDLWMLMVCIRGRGQKPEAALMMKFSRGTMRTSTVMSEKNQEQHFGALDLMKRNTLPPEASRTNDREMKKQLNHL
ncbi:hypothetical protein WMY93_031511 [Mugilogobius chulae]|uniref:Uncharacterized protein n=1 Tax=Mugilogobius chulae TaxID=88201 RepID=A0AAW0MM60_9GOBI